MGRKRVPSPRQGERLRGLCLPFSEYLAFTLLNCNSQVQCAGNTSPVWVWRSDPGSVGAKDNGGCGAIELGRDKDAGAQD